MKLQDYRTFPVGAGRTFTLLSPLFPSPVSAEAALPGPMLGMPTQSRDVNSPDWKLLNSLPEPLAQHPDLIPAHASLFHIRARAERPNKAQRRYVR